MASEAKLERNDLTLPQKYTIVKQLISGKNKDIANEFNVTASAISEIKKSPEIAVQFQQGNWRIEKKRMKLGNYESVDQKHCSWFLETANGESIFQN